MSDKVGYKNPPKHSRFKKGQSGYPSGRSKEKKRQLPDFIGAVVKSLSERVSVVQNGKQRKITKFDSGLIQFANKVAKGDVASFKMLMGMQAQLSTHTPVHAAAEAESTKAVRARIMARLDKMHELFKEQAESDAQAVKAKRDPSIS